MAPASTSSPKAAEMNDAPGFARCLDHLQHLSQAKQDQLKSLFDHITLAIGDDPQKGIMYNVLFGALKSPLEEGQRLFRESDERREEAAEKKEERDVERKRVKAQKLEEKKKDRKQKRIEAENADATGPVPTQGMVSSPSVQFIHFSN